MATRGKPMTGRQEMMMMMMQMVMSMGTNLASFLFRSLKSYRIWLLIAILLTIVQVISDILIAFPFKFILDKIVSHKNPALPDNFLAPFDAFGTTVGLRPGESHTVLGVILVSVCVLILLNALNALTTYVQNTIASVVGKHLTSQPRTHL